MSHSPASPASPSRQTAGDAANGQGARKLIGRTKMSLRNCVLGTPEYTTLPLEVEDAAYTGAAILVNTFPTLENDGAVTEYATLPTAVKALSGKRFDLIVHVISAEGIPKGLTMEVYCQYEFKDSSRGPISTEARSGSTEPAWGYKKRFVWPEFAPDLADYLAADDVLTFEVFGSPS
jgi:hypothetical protein